MRHPATAATAILLLLGFGSAARATITVCNESSATAHVAFADQVKGSYTTTGWWSIPLDACQDVDFTLQGDTLFFTADSDGYPVPAGIAHEHWGEQVQLYVGSDQSQKFTYTDAQMSRSGAQIEKFQTNAITVPPDKLVGIKVHLKKVGSSVEITSRP
jgi:uncharacterized membrane protein